MIEATGVFSLSVLSTSPLCSVRTRLETAITYYTRMWILFFFLSNHFVFVHLSPFRWHCGARCVRGDIRLSAYTYLGLLFVIIHYNNLSISVINSWFGVFHVLLLVLLRSVVSRCSLSEECVAVYVCECVCVPSKMCATTIIADIASGLGLPLIAYVCLFITGTVRLIAFDFSSSYHRSNQKEKNVTKLTTNFSSQSVSVGLKCTRVCML